MTFNVDCVEDVQIVHDGKTQVQQKTARLKVVEAVNQQLPCFCTTVAQLLRYSSPFIMMLCVAF